MKCDNCGFITNPGDQKCIKCGAKIDPMNVVMPGIEKIDLKTGKNKNTKLIFIIVGSIILLALIVFLVIKFLILKG